MSETKAVKIPTVITSRWLRAHSACWAGLDRFKRLFGGRMELTVENLQKGWKALGKEEPMPSEMSSSTNCRSDIAFLAIEVLEPGYYSAFAAAGDLVNASEKAWQRAAHAAADKGWGWNEQDAAGDDAKNRFLYRALVKAVKAREAAAA